MITAVWGPHSSAVAALILARPNLGYRFALAPRKVVHGLAAYISSAIEQGLDQQTIAAHVDVQDIRDLVARAIPNVHARLYGSFERLGDQAMPHAFYRRLNECLCGPASDLLLSSTEPVSEAFLRIVETVVADPVLLAFRTTIGRSNDSLNVVRSLVSFLRATGLSVDLEALPLGSGWRALARRITSDLGRASAPPQPFRCPDGWRHVQHLAELFRLGKQLQNCLAGIGDGGESHIFQFILGQEVYFVRDSEPLMLAAIESAGPGLWRIAEMAGATRRSGRLLQCNELSSPLDVVLAEVGHAQLETAPVSALQALSWRSGSGAADLGEDEVDAAA